MKTTRRIHEQITVSPSGQTPLRVDREKGVIYGVKVLGRFSPNCHGIKGVTEGTEYTPAAFKQAAPLYENAKIYTNHPDRRKPDADRDVAEPFGKLMNCVAEADGIRADLHYLKTHPMAERVVEDVERMLGVFGLSHNADAGATRVANGKFIVEEIATVYSVDLVDRPATNKNLWESRTMTKSLKQLIESMKFKGNKAKWATKLLEADGENYDAPMEMADVAPEATPEDAMTAGFEQAIVALVRQILAGDMEVPAGLAKIKELVTSHDKLTAAAEPEAPVEEEDGEDETKKDEPMTKESVAELVKASIREALKDFKVKTPTKSSGPPAKKVTESEAPKSSKEFASLILE